MQNVDVMRYIWSFKKKGIIYSDIRLLCENIAEGLLRFSMNKLSTDNVSTILIAFNNFENAMRNPNFSSNVDNRCEIMSETYDLYEKE